MSQESATSPVLPLPAPTRGWFGPLFWWELRRESRKGVGYFPRTVYTAGLLLVLYLVMGRTEITQKRISYLCDSCASYYIMLQYLAVFLLTPIYVAGAIIEDRQQRTLSLLLTTFLTPREIVLGKMMGRLMVMLGVLLAGLPVMAILQLLGGVNLFAFTLHSCVALALLFMMGMHAIRASTMCKTLGGAVLVSYCIMIGSGLIVVPFVGILSNFIGGLMGVVVLLVLVVMAFLAFALKSLHGAVNVLSNREHDLDVTQSEMEHYEQQLQSPDPRIAPSARVTEETTAEKPSEIPQRIDRLFRPPAIGRFPIVWKEAHFPPTELLTIFTVLFCGFPLLIFLVHLIDFRREMTNAKSFFVESSHVLMALLLFLVTMRAAGTLVTERKKQTLMSLMTAPLSWTRVVIEYWLGSVWRYRWMGLGTFLVAICIAFYDPTGILFVLNMFLSQLGFFAMLGVAFSTIFSTAFQARLMLCILFFVMYLIMPFATWLTGSSFVWFAGMIIAPYRYWLYGVPVGQHSLDLRINEMAIVSPLLASAILLANLIALWMLTYLLFLLARHRLIRWLQRT